MMNKGHAFIISGPSGSGKSTLLKEVFAARDNMFFSVSATTRDPRPGEVDGKDYFFVKREEFQRMLHNDELLEHAEYVGNCYGTPRGPIDEMTSKGCDVILDIEVQGAMQVKAKMPEAVSIFIAPPSIEELEKRLRGRSTETEEKIAGRLETAKKELALADTYDYKVLHDDVDRAVAELLHIMETESPRE